MIANLILLMALVSDAPGAVAPEPQQQQEVEKQIVYKKDTLVDLSGSQVVGTKQLPPAFFVTQLKAPPADSLLTNRLKFSLKKYNEMGF